MLPLLIFLTLISFVKATCPTGRIEWQSNCYYFQNNQSAFVVAEEYCNSLGGHLASIHDGFTNNFIAQNAGLYFHESTVTDFWIGASDMIVPGNWSWTDGSNFTFTEWNNAKNATGEDCLAQTISDGRWNAEDCFKPKPFVYAVSTIPTNPPFIDCGYSWIYFQPTGYCYGGLPLVHTWKDAEEGCQNLSAHSVSIHSFEEAKFVGSFSHLFWDKIWIDLFSNDDENTWKWTDGTLFDYQLWGTNASNLHVSSCIYNADNYFFDADCSIKYSALCKRKFV